MKKRCKKYRIINFILFPLYVNFFFLTPFLHYHEGAENHFQPDKIDIHSHLITGHHENHTHHGEHNLDSCEDHEHIYKVNTYQFTKLTKQFVLPFVSRIIFLIDLPAKSLKEHFTQIARKELPSKSRWKKHVHSATNSSPPIA